MAVNETKRCSLCGSQNVETYTDEDLRARSRCIDCGSDIIEWRITLEDTQEDVQESTDEPPMLYISDKSIDDGLVGFLIETSLIHEGYDITTNDPDETARIIKRIDEIVAFNKLEERGEERRKRCQQ